MLELNISKYQLVKDPYTSLRILEVMELDNDEIYIRYKQEDKEEDWKIVKLENIDKVFEDYVDFERLKLLENMIDIKDEIPIAGKDIIGLCDDDSIGYYYRCGHAPGCMTWKSAVSGGSVMVDVIKWKYNTSNKTYEEIDLWELF